MSPNEMKRTLKGKVEDLERRLSFEAVQYMTAEEERMLEDKLETMHELYLDLFGYSLKDWATDCDNYIEGVYSMLDYQ